LNLEIVKNYFHEQKEDFINLFVDTVRQVISIDNFRYIIMKPVGIVLNFLKGFGLYALALIFIIPGMDKIPIKILKAFPDEKGPRINEMITNIKESIQNYIVAKSIISFGVGFLSFIICIIFQVKYALLWGVIIFLFNYIPYIGSIIAVIFPVTLSLIQFQSFPHFIFLLIALTTVQVIMGNIIEPKFMSKGVNLSPLIIIVSLLVWGYVWGIAGVILSVPIMSAFNIVCENISSLKPVNILISAEKKKKKKNNI
jgi:predicted PurR-regulated permease PerM